MPNPESHYFEVEMRISELKNKPLELKMATWTPGSYLIREFSKNVENLTAFGAGNTPLPVEKANKNTWRVEAGKEKEVMVTYQVYANEMSVRTSFLNADHGYLNGAGVFLFMTERINMPHQLTIQPPEHWKQVSTGLTRISQSEWIFEADSFDELIDNPIEIGNHQVFTFKAAGVDHEVAVFGEGNYDISRLKEDMTRVVQSSTNVFGTNPNSKYTFIIHNLTIGSGGLEHTNSTTLQVNRWTYKPESKYYNFISLVAHEYFHLWNVKRLMPEELTDLDLEKEVYTTLLWVMEGFTSYYDELIMVPSGIYDADTYLRRLSSTITHVEGLPGNKVQSVSEASFDAWIKTYRPNENSINTTVSYYSKGGLIAAALDLEIIHRTNGERSLDDLMRLLYRKYYLDKKSGFTEDQLKEAIEEIAGSSLNDFFALHINSTKTLEYAKFLNYAGVDFEPQYSQKLELGAVLRHNSDNLKVDNVLRDSPGFKAGLKYGR